MRKALAPFFMIIFLAVLAPSLVWADGNEVVEGELAQKLDLYMTRITPFGFSGALMVVKDDKIILNKGYGLAIRSENVPNTSETVFSTGSITKQFTAAGIMKLEMMGKLNTEDPITQYFDDVPEDKKGITLHNLLTHTSGLIDGTGMDFAVVQRDETMEKILKSPLRHNPGKEFAYSNAGYSMLAAVIEKVSGENYEEFMNENIFAPAGMKYTGYRIPEWDKKVVAHWYRGEKDNGTPLEKDYPYWNYLGNGGILSTTEDMIKWHRALLEDKVLSAAAKKKMFTPFLNEYGYGWDIIQREMGTLIQHDGGSMLGCSAEFRRYIDVKTVTMVFCNQSYGQRALFEAVRGKIETLVFGGTVAIPPEVMTPKPAGFQNLEGTYVLPTGGELRAQQKNQNLVVSAHGQDAISALFDPGHPDPSLYIALNKLSASVFEAALEGDFEPFGAVLANRQRRMKPVQDLIQMRLRMYKPRTGAIKTVKSLATLSSMVDGEKVAMTYVELKGEKGSMFFELHWKDGKNVGVGPTPPPGEMALPFLPVSETEFAGYRIDSAMGAKIGFKMDDKGAVISLIFPENKDILALKQK
jgi:CubicO group peptidase (beta-lactamase class C family)